MRTVLRGKLKSKRGVLAGTFGELIVERQFGKHYIPTANFAGISPISIHGVAVAGRTVAGNNPDVLLVDDIGVGLVIAVQHVIRIFKIEAIQGAVVQHLLGGRSGQRIFIGFLQGPTGFGQVHLGQQSQSRAFVGTPVLTVPACIGKNFDGIGQVSLNPVVNGPYRSPLHSNIGFVVLRTQHQGHFAVHPYQPEIACGTDKQGLGGNLLNHGRVAAARLVILKYVVGTLDGLVAALENGRNT